MSERNSIFAQLSSLPVTATQTVGLEHLDQNGHMNVRHYFDFGTEAMWVRAQGAGFGESYLEARNLTTFAAEQHIRYYSESFKHDRLSIPAVIVRRSARSFLTVAFILNETQSELACVVEAAIVHVNLETRRPVPFPEDIAKEIDSIIAESRGVTLPLSGSIGNFSKETSAV